MRARSTLFLIGLAIVASGCALCGTTTTVEKVELQLDQSLPLGSTRVEVEAWLQAKRIEPYYFAHPDSFSVIRKAVTDVNAYSGGTLGTIRNTGRSLFITEDIRIFFLYGHDGLLAKKIVNWIGTGP